MKADLLTQVILPASLFIIMMGMGLSLKLKDFAMVMTRPKAIAIGLVAQMILLPLLAYVLVLLFQLEPVLGIGLIILALCPGGTTSNLYTYLAKGDVALSVSLTAVVSLIAPFTVPFVLLLFMNQLMGEGQAIELPVLKTIVQLIAITIVPIVLGMVIHRFAPVFAEKAEKPVKIFSVVFLFLIIAGILLKNKATMPGYFADVGLVALVLNLSCMTLGYFLAKWAQLNEAQSKAIGIEVGFQNGTTALLIALTLLGNSAMAAAPTVYSLIMFFTGGIFAYLLNRKSRVPVEAN